MTTANEFLDTIFQDAGEDEHVCVTRAKDKSDGSGTWFSNQTRDGRGWRKWNPDTRADAWYFCVSTVDGALNDKGSMLGRGRGNLKRVYCLVLDDIGTKGKAPPVEPTWKMETSPGNFQWGYALDATDRLPEFEALVSWCAEQGWSDAGAGGSYRVMRVPGSANMKPGRDEFRARLTHWEPEWIWSIDDVADDLGCDLAALPAPDAGAGVRAAPEDRVGALVDLDPMLVWLTAEGHVTKDAGTQWVEMVCPWADAHTSGDSVAGYSPLGRGPTQFVQTRAFKCMHEHCADKKLKELVKWAEPLGGPFVSGYDPLPWLQAQYAYVETGQVVVDLAQRPVGGVWRWTFADWQKRHPGKVRTLGRDAPVSVATAFVESLDTKKAVDTTYLPVRRHEDKGMVVDFNQNYVNTYVPPNWPEIHDTPEIFLEHVKFLIPSDEEREVFMNWLAYKIQNPASRSYAVVMIAEDKFGTGRSWIKNLLAKMLQGGVETATLAQIVGQGTSSQQNYNDWEVGCQYIVCEEARGDMSQEDKTSAYEEFKVRCDTTPSEVRVNVKYGATTGGMRYWNSLIFSNHADAMAVAGDDRRVYVVTNPSERRDYEYYDRLQASLTNGEPARAYWWLMHRDLTGYKHIYPPWTAAKAAMIEHSSSPCEDIMAWLEENHTSDLVTQATLRSGVMVAASALNMDKIVREPGGITKRVWRLLKSLRPEDVKHGARYVIGGKQTEVRALRKREMWVEFDGRRDVSWRSGAVAQEMASKSVLDKTLEKGKTTPE